MSEERASKVLHILGAPYRAVEHFFDSHQLTILIGGIVSAILLLVMWPSVIITVHSGEGGVLFRRFTGTDMSNVYPEGLYVIFPWDKMYRYNTRIQTVERTIELLTRDGLPLKLTVVIRYRPDYRLLPQLHTVVGPDYMERVVLPGTLSTLRKVFGNYEPAEIYNNKRGVLDRIFLDALQQNGERFVIIDEVMVTSIELPEPLRQSIEDKMIFEQRQLTYEYKKEMERQEAERKRIEASGIHDYNKIIQETLTPDILHWQGVQATKELATSHNAKTVIIGGGSTGLPLILGNVDGTAPAPAPPAAPASAAPPPAGPAKP